MGNRQQIERFSKDQAERYLIRRSFDNKEVQIVVFNRKENVSKSVLEICASSNGFVYESKGELAESFNVPKWSIKKVVEQVESVIQEEGRYWEM